MNPYDGNPLKCFYRKIPYSGRWLVLSEFIPLTVVPPQHEFDFSTLENDDEGSIQEPDTYEGGGGGGGETRPNPPRPAPPSVPLPSPAPALPALP